MRPDPKARQLPDKFRPYVGEYGPCLYDAVASVPIMWGYPIPQHLGPQLWEEIQHYGRVEYTMEFVQKYFLITKYLTPAEAKRKYGKVTNLELGPRGGFRSVTYGTKKFINRQLDPRPENERP